ncbi:copper chaperone PCu(A)C [Streptomyces spongiae]|uniref:Copper chaperone PCu(A)C n=1 Tax=Streptomyces spongiae TaxID=565072 RepID=A0A5N8XQD4_9ACTN|nr:copper chaperone PCu(A)C [Streptomyces spongiae]MPY61633.1 copper chaperone PCu(A)C [Streptomyces spongiae]
MTVHPWRPTRRRLADALRAALAPVAACSVALGGLTTWALSGNAVTARIAVTDAHVYLPYGNTRDTAAFFRITNSGGAGDRLLKVTMAGAGGGTELSRHRMTSGRAAYAETVDSAEVPAGASLAMSPSGLDVTLRAKPGWREFDFVPFTLHFQRSGRVEALAIVVRPGRFGA